VSCKNKSTVHNDSKFKQNIVSKDKTMVQYFTAPSFFYPNQESYGLTKDQSMGGFHVKNMETYKS
jgi:hypothetical protein